MSQTEPENFSRPLLTEKTGAHPLAETCMEAGSPDGSAQSARQRPWPVTTLGLLLFLQAAGLFGFGSFHFMQVNFPVMPDQPWTLTVIELLSEITYSSLMGLVFIPLSLLALVTGIGFLRLWRIAWLNAMLVQGLSLLVAIIFYLRHKPAYVYVIMVYSIFMVIYLHHSEVQTTFQISPAGEKPREER